MSLGYFVPWVFCPWVFCSLGIFPLGILCLEYFVQWTFCFRNFVPSASCPLSIITPKYSPNYLLEYNIGVPNLLGDLVCNAAWCRQRKAHDRWKLESLARKKGSRRPKLGHLKRHWASLLLLRRRSSPGPITWSKRDVRIVVPLVFFLVSLIYLCY